MQDDDPHLYLKCHSSTGVASNLEHTISTVTTCCILHNFCIITKRRFLHEWLQQTEVGLIQNRNNSRCVEAVNKVELMRSAIRDYLADHWPFFLNIFINKRNITVGKYIFKSSKGKGKDKNETVSFYLFSVINLQKHPPEVPCNKRFS